MANYKGKLPGRRRIVIWWRGRPNEWVVKGTKRDGDAFEARKRLELRARSSPSERRVAATFFELSTEYAVHAEHHLKASTWRVRKFQIEALTSYLGSMRLPELTPGTIDAYKRARLKEKLRASSINNELRVLRTILNWATEMGHDVPATKWRRLPERGNPRPRAFSADEIERLWAACRKRAPWMLPMLVFLVNTGCRKGEAIAAEWSWVDFDASMLRIPSTRYWQPKSGRPREVPMSDSLRAVLSGRKLHKRALFPNAHRRPYAEFPKDTWGEVVTEAGLSGGPHQLRHTFASHFLHETRDLKLLAEVMGHSHGRVTELYAHLLPGHLDRARNAVNLGPGTMAVTVAAKFGPKGPRQKTG